MVSHISANLSRNAIGRLLHPQSKESQGHGTFSVISADKQIRNYDTECSNHQPSKSPQDTGIELQQDKMVKYANLSRKAIDRLPYP